MSFTFGYINKNMSINLAVATLVQEAEQLDNTSLDAFIADVISLRKRREIFNKSKTEALLLQKINKSLSIEQIERFRTLYQKQKGNTLTEQEYSELVSLLDKIEKLNLSRLKHLTALAQLRHISVRELMTQLGISNPVNG